MCTAQSDVSVVILTRNSARTLERCLESVTRENPKEIIAVDGLSVDRSLSILQQYGVRVLADPMCSLGHARQVGVNTASSTFVMFVDSDIELGPDCIRTLVSELEEYGWAGIHARLLSSENVSYWQRSEDEVLSRFDHAGPRSNIATAAAVFRRGVLLRHPFDSNFVESAEDVDLCHRLSESKHQVGVSSAVAYHRHRREFSAFAKRKFTYGIGEARLALKYRSIRTLLGPLRSSVHQVMLSMVTRRMRLIPYWVAGGAARFLGVLVGVSRIRRLPARRPSV